MGMSPLKYHSNSGPTSSSSPAMKPSTDTTACMITVAMPEQASEVLGHIEAHARRGGKVGHRAPAGSLQGRLPRPPLIGASPGLDVGSAGQLQHAGLEWYGVRPDRRRILTCRQVGNMRRCDAPARSRVRGERIVVLTPRLHRRASRELARGGSRTMPIFGSPASRTGARRVQSAGSSNSRGATQWLARPCWLRAVGEVEAASWAFPTCADLPQVGPAPGITAPVVPKDRRDRIPWGR